MGTPQFAVPTLAPLVAAYTQPDRPARRGQQLAFSPLQQFDRINPTILKRGGSQIGEEGCLSIPGFREDVRRAAHVVVQAKDVDGNDIEVDHLHGILFLNHWSPLKRDLIRRKIEKLQKAGAW